MVHCRTCSGNLRQQLLASNMDVQEGLSRGSDGKLNGKQYTIVNIVQAEVKQGTSGSTDDGMVGECVSGGDCTAA
jgi:hypothetical protein